MITSFSPSSRLLLAFGLVFGLAGAARAQFEIRGNGFNRLYAPLSVSGSASPLAGLTLTNAGSGYSTAPTVSISGGGGSGATATVTVAGGLVTGFILTAPGSGYTSMPTVTITGVGTGATARAVFRAVPDGGSPAVTTPQFAGLAANTAGFAARSTSATLSARYPAQLYLIAGTSTPTGVAMVHFRGLFGGSFAAGVPRYSFGDTITPPATQDGGILAADASYWRSQPVRIGESARRFLSRPPRPHKLRSRSRSPRSRLSTAVPVTPLCRRLPLAAAVPRPQRPPPPS
jgi:hypothetical protein